LNFVLWVCRSLHLIGIVIWLGGLMFQSAVLQPVLQHNADSGGGLNRQVSRRFTGFVWMSVWTMLITGVIMMLLNPHFLWFQFKDTWSVIVGIKEVVFILMVLYATGYARMLKYLDSPSSNGGFNEKAELYKHRLDQFRRMNIALGIIGIFLGAALYVYA
jgi:uncharacterized membrane protein